MDHFPEIKKLARVALVGRRNVGKSTLFNALAGGRRAIIADQPGVTVDSLESIVRTDEGAYILYDLPGLDLESEEELDRDILRLAREQLSRARLFLLVLEYPELTPFDSRLWQLLKKENKPILVILNKVDNPALEEKDFSDYYEAGLGEVLPVSARGRRGLPRLREKIANALEFTGATAGGPGETAEEAGRAEDAGPVRVAIVGRPNCGKSSLLNRVLGYERAVVSDMAGTTRDSNDTWYRLKTDQGWREIILVDTAGIRKKKNQASGVEYYSILRAQRAAEEADIILQVVDAGEGITRGDKKIGAFIEELGKPSLLVLNKWDLVDTKKITYLDYVKDLESAYPFARRQTKITVSALSGQRVPRLLEEALEIHDQQRQKAPTSQLNQLFQEILAQAPGREGRNPAHLLYVTQTKKEPPTYRLFVRDPRAFTPSIQAFIRNQVARRLGMKSVPIRLELADPSKKRARRKKRIGKAAPIRGARKKKSVGRKKTRP